MSEKPKRVWLETYCFLAQDHLCGSWCSLFDATRKQCAIWDRIQISASIDETLKSVDETLKSVDETLKAMAIKMAIR